MATKTLTPEAAAALLAGLMHARTWSATRRHYTADTTKTLCGGRVALPERYTEDGADHVVPLETLFMETRGPREYCANCLRGRARLERLAALAAPAAEPVEQAPAVPVRSLAALLAAGHAVEVDGMPLSPVLVEALRGALPVHEVAEWAAGWIAGQVELGTLTPAAGEVLTLAAAYVYSGRPCVLPVQPYTVPSLAAWLAPGRSVFVEGLEITVAKVEELRGFLWGAGNTALSREVWVGNLMCLDRITQASAEALVRAAATCPNCDAVHEMPAALTVELSTCPGDEVDHEHGEDCGPYGAACFTGWDAAHEWARAASTGAPGYAAVYALGTDGVPCADAGAYVDGKPVD